MFILLSLMLYGLDIDSIAHANKMNVIARGCDLQVNPLKPSDCCAPGRVSSEHPAFCIHSIFMFSLQF